jgi:hypothetical protein
MCMISYHSGTLQLLDVMPLQRRGSKTPSRGFWDERSNRHVPTRTGRITFTHACPKSQVGASQPPKMDLTIFGDRHKSELSYNTRHCTHCVFLYSPLYGMPVS